MKEKVTIVIPTYNEKKNIDKIQNELKKLKGDFKVIFSDGFSQDGSYEKIYFPKIQEAKYRSNQMNAAANYIYTDYIWFVHADSKLDENSIKAIEESQLEAGCFSIKFGSQEILMKLEEAASNLRVDIRKIAFGDQGIFIKSTLFRKIGGYKKIPLMEDYQLSMDLKNFGIKIKRLTLPIYTSPVRFKKNGIIKNIIKMQYLQFLYRQGRDIQEIAKIYNN